MARTMLKLNRLDNALEVCNRSLYINPDFEDAKKLLQAILEAKNK